jgi:predicted ABC-type transport system involved in lysophospholipase L1 biosynthesis ATPase subunit
MALRGIDLEIHRGDMLVGPSGYGKTTLISIVAAILNQDSGKCEVLGRDLQHMGETERARFRGVSIGFVFQVVNLLPALTAVENVAVPLLISGVSRKHAEARAREVLEAVELRSRVSARPAHDSTPISADGHYRRPLIVQWQPADNYEPFTGCHCRRHRTLFMNCSIDAPHQVR